MFNPGVGGEIQRTVQGGATGWKAHESRWEGTIRKTQKDRLKKYIELGHWVSLKARPRSLGFVPHSPLFIKMGQLVFSSYEKCFNSKYIFLINPDTIMKTTCFSLHVIQEQIPV